MMVLLGENLGRHHVRDPLSHFTPRGKKAQLQCLAVARFVIKL